MLNKSLYLLIVALLACSCEMVVEVDIPESKPTLVVNSVIDPSEPFVSHVSNSLGILDRGIIKNIDSALVEIYENDLLLEKLEFVGEGIYISNTKKPVAGKKYKIVVDASPYQQIQATVEIPQSVSMSDVIYKDSAYSDPNMGYLSSITFTLHDPGSIKNFYATNVFYTDTFFFQPSTVYIHTNDPAIESNSYGSEGLLFSDEHFNGKDYKFEILFQKQNFENMEGGYELFINISCVSPEYFLYKTTLAKHIETAHNPFAEPAQVYTNVQNGLGIFAARNNNLILIQK